MTASPTVLPNFATHVVSGGPLRSGNDEFGVLLARWLTQILDIAVATIGKKLHTIPKMLGTLGSEVLVNVTTETVEKLFLKKLLLVC